MLKWGGQSAECRKTSNIQHPTSNIQRRTLNLEPRTLSLEKRDKKVSVNDNVTFWPDLSSEKLHYH
jgi:hypothetical protein